MKLVALWKCFVVTLVASASPVIAEHTAHIEVIAAKGRVGAHFSRYDGRKYVEWKDGEGNVWRIPTAGSHFTKLCARDDSTKPSRITPGNPWVADCKFNGAGVYILDLSDWDDHPEVTVTLTIDGVVRFRGHGSANNYDKWPDKQYGPATRKTDDREIAIDLKSD